MMDPLDLCIFLRNYDIFMDWCFYKKKKITEPVGSIVGDFDTANLHYNDNNN